MEALEHELEGARGDFKVGLVASELKARRAGWKIEKSTTKSLIPMTHISKKSHDRGRSTTYFPLEKSLL